MIGFARGLATCLPLLDGLSLVRLARQDDKLRHIPLLAISASVMNGEHKLALDARCHRLLHLGLLRAR